MAEIKLSQNKIAIIDDEDYVRVSSLKWFAHKRTNKFYAETARNEKHMHLHRFILGINDRSIIIDHIDGDSLNNKKSNLRICTVSQNSFNKKPYSNSPIKGIKGVSFIKRINKWRAQIQANKKKIYIGVYNTHIDAAIAYNERAKELFGEYAYLNKLT